ncbi:hypothetical protein MYXO_01265 [Myxococcaceae bacterium]|nr:hypothetical protein MYXO_01265 [Myxococcaceae bacterium]
MEHLEHFGFARDPFAKDRLAPFHFESTAASDAERRLLRGCLQHRSLCVLSGGVGHGKSTVLRRVLEQLDDERFDAHLLVLANAATDASWLMARVASLLGVEEPAADWSRVCGEIFDRLAALHEEGRHAVLLVDDAQLLARPGPLSALRTLLDLDHEGRHLLSVVLAGTADLERGIALDAGLAQRVDLSMGLAPLDAESVAAFIAHRIRVAGGDPALFEPAALGEVAKRSRGVPRLVLGLADNALHEAWLLGTARVGLDAVARAVHDLGLALGAAPAPGVPGPDQTFFAAGDESLFGAVRHGRTEPEIAPLFDGSELDATAILPEDGPPKDEDELETLLEDEVR